MHTRKERCGLGGLLRSLHIGVLEIVDDFAQTLVLLLTVGEDIGVYARSEIAAEGVDHKIEILVKQRLGLRAKHHPCSLIGHGRGRGCEFEALQRREFPLQSTPAHQLSGSRKSGFEFGRLHLG